MKNRRTKIADVPDSKWLDRLHGLVEHQMLSGDLSNGALALQMKISERHFIRRLKALTGLPPQQYLRGYRLQLAKAYLETGTIRSVRATARAIGYQSTSHFILQFEQAFGQKPLAILQASGWR